MSQFNSVEKEIGESTYSMYMLKPITSHNLLMDVVKMVGPGLGSVVGSLFSGADKQDAKTIMEKEVNPELITGALSQLFKDVNKQTLEQVIKAFRQQTHVDGKELNGIFDVHFMGKLDEMYIWLTWGMSVQWGKSLSALASGVSGPGAAKARAAVAALQSPSTSTGSSGDQ